MVLTEEFQQVSVLGVSHVPTACGRFGERLGDVQDVEAIVQKTFKEIELEVAKSQRGSQFITLDTFIGMLWFHGVVGVVHGVFDLNVWGVAEVVSHTDIESRLRIKL